MTCGLCFAQVILARSHETVQTTLLLGSDLSWTLQIAAESHLYRLHSLRPQTDMLLSCHLVCPDYASD